MIFSAQCTHFSDFEVWQLTKVVYIYSTQHNVWVHEYAYSYTLYKSRELVHTFPYVLPYLFRLRRLQFMMQIVSLLQSMVSLFIVAVVGSDFTV